jgi:predicted secreted protein
MAGEIGYGLSVLVSDAFPAATPTNVVGEVVNVTPPNVTRDIIDVTSSSSLNMTREFIAGLIDPGEVSIEINWLPGSATDVLLRGISAERNPRTWRIIWTQMTPDQQITFTAFLTGYERNSPMDDKMTATLTLKATGVSAWV